MPSVHTKFDPDRLSRKRVIRKIRLATFVEFGYHLGLRVSHTMYGVLSSGLG